MKRLILICTMILCLAPVGVQAESADAPALYPVRINGLWGYMNRSGETVIGPQWDHAGPFAGGTAIVGTGEDGDMLYGLILRDGSVAVPVRYPGLEDCGDFCLVSGSRDGVSGPFGWYDKASGFFQEPVWDEASDSPTDSGLILVSRYVDEETEHIAYVFRENGREAFSFECTGEHYTDGTFHEGYAFWCIEYYDEETGRSYFDAYLLDTRGNRVAFPEKIIPWGNVRDGVLPVETDEEEPRAGFAQPGGGVLFMLPEGAWPIADASEGRVFFTLDGKTGIMDPEGNVILPPELDYDPGYNHFGREDEPAFHNGYALLMLCDAENNRSYVFVSRDGRTVFRMDTVPADGVRTYPCTFSMENDLAFYIKSTLFPTGGYETGYGLIRLTEQGGEYLTEPVFDRIAPLCKGFMEIGDGLMAVSMNGLWGYIDENAQWVIPPRYDSAGSFRDGLALVEKDGKLMYIDRSGTAVWKEQ